MADREDCNAWRRSLADNTSSRRVFVHQDPVPSSFCNDGRNISWFSTNPGKSIDIWYCRHKRLLEVIICLLSTFQMVILKDGWRLIRRSFCRNEYVISVSHSFLKSRPTQFLSEKNEDSWICLGNRKLTIVFHVVLDQGLSCTLYLPRTPQLIYHPNSTEMTQRHQPYSQRIILDKNRIFKIESLRNRKCLLRRDEASRDDNFKVAARFQILIGDQWLS